MPRRILKTLAQLSTGRPSYPRAYLLSLCAHAGVMASMLLMSARAAERYSLDGDRQAMRLNVAMSPASAELVVDVAAPVDVVPVDAQIPPARIANAAKRIELQFRREYEKRTPVANVAEDITPTESQARIAKARLAINVARPRPSQEKIADAALHEARLEEARPELSTSPALAQPRPELDQVADHATPTPRRQSAALVPSQPAVEIPQLVGTCDKTPPDFSTAASPVYPAEAQRRRIEGTVLVELHVAETGQVEQARVLRSSGHAVLDESALRAVRGWRGRPAYLNDQPVASVESVPIRFRLSR